MALTARLFMGVENWYLRAFYSAQSGLFFIKNPNSNNIYKRLLNRIFSVYLFHTFVPFPHTPQQNTLPTISHHHPGNLTNTIPIITEIIPEHLSFCFSKLCTCKAFKVNIECLHGILIFIYSTNISLTISSHSYNKTFVQK